MAFYDFAIAHSYYELNDVTEKNYMHDALQPLGETTARLFALTRKEGNNDVFVATIVGDECRVMNIRKWHTTFASFEECIASSTDKIAVMHSLQYLNNEEYKRM